MENEDPNELLSAEEVANKLGCDRRSVLIWRQQGIIPAAIHRGKFIRFSMPAVRAALRKDAEKQVY
jgi:predicted site-specific integrase-resolvase